MGNGLFKSETGLTSTSYDLETTPNTYRKDSGTVAIDILPQGVYGYADRAYFLYSSPYPKPEAPTNLNWNGNLADWSDVTGADGYMIYLYQSSGGAYGHWTTTESQSDFSTVANPAADWYFMVKATVAEYVRDSIFNECPRKTAPTSTTLWPFGAYVYDETLEMEDSGGAVSVTTFFNEYDWSNAGYTDVTLEGTTVTVNAKPAEGYEFPTYDNGTSIMPGVSATVNGYYANVTKAYEQDPSRYITVEYNFGEVTAYIDGTEVTGWTNSVTTNSDNTITVRYSFRKGASAPEAAIYAFLTQPTGGATLTVGEAENVAWETNFLPVQTEIQYWDGKAWDQWDIQYPEYALDDYDFVSVDAGSIRFRIAASIDNSTNVYSNEFTITWKEPVSFSWSGNACTVTLEKAESDALVIAASYENGRMIQSAVLTGSATLSGDTVRVFFLNKTTYSPLRSAIKSTR